MSPILKIAIAISAYSLLFTCMAVVVALTLGIKIRQVSLGSVRLDDDDQLYRKFWLTQVMFHLSAPLILLIAAIAVVGPSGWDSFISAFVQIILGAIGPFSTASDYLSEIENFVNHNTFLTVFALVAIKASAFNLLPFRMLSGGEALILIIDDWFIEWYDEVRSLLLLPTIIISCGWILAIGEYLWRSTSFAGLVQLLVVVIIIALVVASINVAINFILRSINSILRGIELSRVTKMETAKDVSGLTKALLYQDTRVAAINALGKIGGEEAVRTLLHELNDPDKNIQKVAIEALRSHPQLFITELDDLTFGAQSSVINILGQIGSEEAIILLIAALKDKEQHIRRDAKDVLKRTRVKLPKEALKEIKKIEQIEKEENRRRELDRIEKEREEERQLAKSIEIFPENWQSAENRAVLITIIRRHKYSSSYGKRCPYFLLGTCMFRIISKQQFYNYPEECSLTTENHENCAVWQIDPRESMAYRQKINVLNSLCHNK